MALIKKYIQSAFSKKKHYVFLLFVLCTCVFWLINQLSKNYNQVVNYEVVYVDLPDAFVFQEAPPSTISVRLHTTGYYFFKKAFTSNQLEISLKNVMQEGGYQYFLSNTNISKQVRLSINDRVQVIEILEDRLLFKLGKRSFKKVPVIPNLQIDYHLGYHSFEGVQLYPDSIQVSGPELQLKKVDKIYLEPYQETDVLTSISQNLPIVKPQGDKLTFDHESVRVEIEVEKVTEKTLILPIQVINTGNKEVVVYPKKIKVHCKVRLSQFNEINESDFIVVTDFNKRGDKYIATELIKKPSSILSVKVQTDKVEYLILKQ
ncbi:hypothetical protein ACXGQW_10125 [Wenyingzhuangia sp. IMCC45533]